MTPRQVRDGRPVRLTDAVRHAVRCWSPARQTIVGAGRVEFPRWVLDLPGIIVAHGDARRRVLIGWPTASMDGERVAGGDAGPWGDYDQIEPGPARPKAVGAPTPRGPLHPRVSRTEQR